MSEVKRKLHRMQRVHSLETSQMNVLIGEVVRIDAKLSTQKEQLTDLIDIREQGLVDHDDYSVEYLTQIGVWIDSVNRSIQLAKDLIDKTQSERDEAQTRVLDQRTRVRGLEMLLDQLRLEFDADVDAEQMLLADENALKEFARK